MTNTGPVIGITTDIKDVDGEESFSMDTVYAQAVLSYGGVPLLIPSTPDHAHAIRRAVSMVDGLLLPGGRDIDPSYYGEEPHANLAPIDPKRTEAEMIALGAALEWGKPVLGICNGLQLINVFLGGSLYQDMPSQLPAAGEHRGGVAHEVVVKPGTDLRGILMVERFSVKSHHHQSVKAVGRGLRVSAASPDGVVEAIEDATGERSFLLGVQWHSERDSSELSKRIFESFFKRCV